MIELRVKGKTFKFFSKIDVTLRLDTVASTFGFDGYLDLESQNNKEIFKPMQYTDCEIWYNDPAAGILEKLITGTILNPGLSVQGNIQLTNISGYSKTGIFEDVNISPDLHPLQYDNLSLEQITKQITDFYGIQLFIFDNAKVDAAKAYTKVKAEPSETIKSFLSKLCRSRNITLAHDNLGRLLLYKVLAKIPPIVKIDENDETLKISTRPNAQAIHSDITVIRQASADTDNFGQFTVSSPFVPNNIKRPKVVILQNGSINDVELEAKAIASAEAKNFPIIIEKEGWTIQDKIIRSGFYIQVNAPSIFIDTTKLIVETIQFTADPNTGKRMKITAVLPCVYTGELPAQSPFK